MEGDELVSLRTFKSADRFTSGAAFSPNGRMLATGGRDIVLWSLPELEVVGVLKGHTRASTRLAFSPDSRILASIADDRTVRLWHVNTQREMIRLQAPEQDQFVFLVEFSPDGRALAYRRSDSQGDIHWLLHAPSFAEIAVAEGADYRPLAGEDPATWLNVAKALQRENRCQEALEACEAVLQRTENRPELTWLRDRMRLPRIERLKRLGRFKEAGLENCAALAIPPRDPSTPAGAIDLSAFYNVALVEPEGFHGINNDLRELPVGAQTLAGTAFDVRGKLHLVGPSPERPWPFEPSTITGIPIQRHLQRLHFLHAAGMRSRDIPVGERIGHYRIHYADGTHSEIPIRYHVDTCDWWELDHLPTELPEAVVAWRGANPRSRSEGKRSIRLFKRTWENPHSALEVISMDVVAEHPHTHPFLVAITAE